MRGAAMQESLLCVGFYTVSCTSTGLVTKTKKRKSLVILVYDFREGSWQHFFIDLWSILAEEEAVRVQLPQLVRCSKQWSQLRMVADNAARIPASPAAEFCRRPWEPRAKRCFHRAWLLVSSVFVSSEDRGATAVPDHSGRSSSTCSMRTSAHSAWDCFV